MKRPRSHSQPSSTSGWLRERTRRTPPSRTVPQVLQPTAHMPQTLGMSLISQGLRLEAVDRRGQSPDRAQLDDVARETTAVRLVLERRDHGGRPALAGDELLVLGDVLREARAAVAEDAALAVERDQRRDGERLLVGALVEVEARVARPVAVRQVLQRALAALVAHRAVEGVVEQDELEHRLLALGRVLGARVHLHAVAGGHGAGGLQLRHALDLDEAHAARADRGPEPGLVAEDRDLDPGIRRGDHERRALRHGQLAPVDLERDGRDVGRAHDGATVSRGSRLRGCGYSELSDELS